MPLVATTWVEDELVVDLKDDDDGPPPMTGDAWHALRTLQDIHPKYSVHWHGHWLIPGWSPLVKRKTQLERICKAKVMAILAAHGYVVLVRRKAYLTEAGRQAVRPPPRGQS